MPNKNSIAASIIVFLVVIWFFLNLSSSNQNSIPAYTETQATAQFIGGMLVAVICGVAAAVITLVVFSKLKTIKA
jgi:hypothetical protein